MGVITQAFPKLVVILGFPLSEILAKPVRKREPDRADLVKMKAEAGFLASDLSCHHHVVLKGP